MELHKWPLTCPWEGATRVERLESRLFGHGDYLIHHYEKRNIHSGEKFTVALHSSFGPGMNPWEYLLKAVFVLHQ